MPLYDHGLLPYFCCSYHQKVECIFPSLWFVLALWLSYQYNARTDVLELLTPKFKRLFASAFTWKNHSHHMKKSRISCCRKKPGGERALGDRKPSRQRGPVKENQSPRHMRKPSQHQVKEKPSRPSQLHPTLGVHEWSHLATSSPRQGQPWQM